MTCLREQFSFSQAIDHKQLAHIERTIADDGLFGISDRGTESASGPTLKTISIQLGSTPAEKAHLEAS
jgi:hypothetical protein